MSVKRILAIVLIFAAGTAVGALSVTVFNSPTSPAASAASAAALCETHHVPENQCTRCNPELIPQFKARGDWCDEHNLPESQCDLCAREENDAAHQGHDTGHDHIEDTTPEPPVAVAEGAGISLYLRESQKICPTNGAIIQLASVQTAERAGLTVEPVAAVPFAPLVEAPAEVVFDETRTRAVTTTVSASVIRWLAEPGQNVLQGQAIAELESSEMPTMKAEFVEAAGFFHAQEQDRIRKEQLYREEVVSAADYQSSVAATQAAQARLTRAQGLLQAAGLSSEELQALKTLPAIDARFILRSPSSGVVAQRLAKPGDLLPAGTSLAMVSDPEFLWVEAQVRDRDLSLIRLGHDLEFVADGSGITRAAGRVTWVASFLDPETRTGTVRARVFSQTGEVRPGEVGRARIRLGTETPTVLIPRDAVQWEGCCNVVFVQETADRFRPRKVRVEPADNHHYRATSGLQPGERVAVQGSFLLKTELKKGSLGVGCAGHDAET